MIGWLARRSGAAASSTSLNSKFRLMEGRLAKFVINDSDPAGAPRTEPDTSPTHTLRHRRRRPRLFSQGLFCICGVFDFTLLPTCCSAGSVPSFYCAVTQSLFSPCLRRGSGDAVEQNTFTDKTLLQLFVLNSSSTIPSAPESVFFPPPFSVCIFSRTQLCDSLSFSFLFICLRFHFPSLPCLMATFSPSITPSCPSACGLSVFDGWGTRRRSSRL